jgi:hypothetical protein
MSYRFRSATNLKVFCVEAFRRDFVVLIKEDGTILVNTMDGLPYVKTKDNSTVKAKKINKIRAIENFVISIYLNISVAEDSVGTNEGI